MISTTHTLLALAVFTRKGDKVRNRSVFWGSVIPDAFIYIAWVILTFFMKVPQSTIWNDIYFDEPMQTFASIFNSIPIYIALLGIGYHYRSAVLGKALMFFSLAALSHISLDFPVHNHDAYAHFWPVSDWRFFSPISYYEEHLHGRTVGMIDLAIGIVASLFVWKRFDKIWVRSVLGLLILLMTLLILMRLGVLRF